MVAGFSSGRTHHELLLIQVGEDAAPIPPGRRVGMYHFGLNVGETDDDLREALAAVVDAGGTVVGASDHTVTHSLYVLDPDGNEIELYVDVPGWTGSPSRRWSRRRSGRCGSDRRPAARSNLFKGS